MAIATFTELSELKLLEGNPKDHDIGEIIVSLRRFGYIDRIVVNEVTGNVIGGNGRVIALKQMEAMKEEKPEGIVKNEWSGKWIIPVDMVKIEEREEKAAVLALNKIEERGGWNENLLEELLLEMERDGVSLEGTGFIHEEVEGMVNEFEEEEVEGGIRIVVLCDSVKEVKEVKDRLAGLAGIEIIYE